MVSFNRQIDSNAKSEFDPIPAGWYPVVIEEIEDCVNKMRTGKYLKFKLRITGPEYNNRVLFTNVNYQNPNSKAEDIAYQQLGQMAGATGIANLTQSEQLINKQLEVFVKIRKSEEYGDSNEIRNYRALSNAVPAMQAAPAAPQQQFAAPAPQAAPPVAQHPVAAPPAQVAPQATPTAAPQQYQQVPQQVAQQFNGQVAQAPPAAVAPGAAPWGPQPGA